VSSININYLSLLRRHGKKVEANAKWLADGSISHLLLSIMGCVGCCIVSNRRGRSKRLRQAEAIGVASRLGHGDVMDLPAVEPPLLQHDGAMHALPTESKEGVDDK
jgi:hypothetical protein